MSLASETEAAGRAFPRLQWGPVIAGVLVALAGHVVLGLVGVALGLAAGAAGSQASGAGAALWAIATPFAATAGGAWLACRLAGATEARAASLHGILVWCVGLVIGAVLLAELIASGALAAADASGGLGAGGPFPGDAASERDAAAASAGAAALAAISGLLGAVVGAAIAGRRRQGPALGWRIAIQRREESGAGLGEAPRQGRGYAPGTWTGRVEQRRGAGEPPGVGPPGDPSHHH